MIISKHPKPENSPKVNVNVNVNTFDETEEDIYALNPLCEVFEAVKDIIGQLKEDEENPNSPTLFKVIAMNTGQLQRIVNGKINLQGALRFPAVLLHFINVRYLVGNTRVGEGRCTMRIQYIMDRVDPSNPKYELEGYRFFQRINVAIQDNKLKYPALRERFQLLYFDQPERLANGLQPYWIDYEVWFKDYTASKYRNYVDKYVVVAPFTNHSDQKPECNENNHQNHKEPTYDEVSGFKK